MSLLRKISPLAAFSAALAATAAEPVSYWNQIRPILQADCQGCHQPAKAKGDYILTDVAQLIAGGESGEAVVAHKPDESFLLDQIIPHDGEAEMPPDDGPLTETEIAMIRRWIAEGAKDDTPENARQKYDMEHPPEYAVPPVITSMDYSPDGSLLAVAGFHEVLLHKPDGTGLVARLVGLSERIESVRFSPDGTMLAVTGGLPGRMGEVQVWDVAKRKLKTSVPVTFDTVYGASWSPDNKLVAFGCSDNSLRAVTAAKGEQVLYMGGHNDWVLDTVFSVKGDHLVSVGRDMSTKLTEVETERLVDNVTSITPGALKGGIAAITRHPERDEVLVGGSDGVPQVYRMSRQTARKIGDNANLVRKFDPMKGRIWGVAYSVDGKRIAAVSSLDGAGMVNIYQAEFDGRLPDDVKKIFEKRVQEMKAEERKRLDDYWSDGVKLLASLEIPETPVFSVAFAPDGKSVAAAGADGTIRFISVPDGKIVKTLVPVEVSAQVAGASGGPIGSELINLKRGKRAEATEKAPRDGEIAKLTVTPETITFLAPNDYVQVLVTAHLTSGGTADVTRLVKWQPAGGLVKVSAHGLVQPVSDGDGEVVVKIAGKTAKIPVAVLGTGKKFVPEYVRDVKPVISRLGCDAGTCHGAKDGKNGFKLSLRGYDPLFDVRAFSDDIAARRVNFASPDDSLMLLKATGAVPHEGKQVTEHGSEYYRILRSWIANGARLDDPAPVVTSIEVFPKNPVIKRIGGQQQIRVVANYKDGTRRDVTREAYMESGNIEVAMHDDFGLMTTLRRGEVPVLARFEGAYAATTVTVMGDRSGFAWEPPPGHNEIDRFVANKWQRMKIRPSGLCTDEEFLRRVYLDLKGLPPLPEQVTAFVADQRPTREKRDAVVDELIGSPAFVDHWANKWADMLMVNSKFLGKEGAVAYRAWIREQVEKNTPYDQFVYSILTATGSNKENPAASYFKIHRTPDMLMENTTHLFLATRFNCNKCHDHPFERWTQDQYYETAAYFAQVKLEPDAENSGKSRVGGTAVEKATFLYEIATDMPEGEMTHERTGKVTPPAFPYIADYDTPAEAPTRRQELAAWMTSGDNRFFAKSYANRIWGYLLGTGVIEPLDDIRAGNPPSNPELLDWLTKEFVKSEFDVRHLMRTICKSRTYQLSIETNKWNADDEINFSHAKARRLPAEVLFDAVYAVTGATPKIPGAKPGTRAQQLDDARTDLKSGFLANLGRPARESACECDRANDVQLGAVMALLSGPAVADAIGDGENAIAKLVAATPDDRELIEKIFLRVINRMPTSQEVEMTLASWAEIDADHELLKKQLAEKEAEWLPIEKQREAARAERIKRAKDAVTAYQPEHDKERQRLEAERAKREAEAKAAVDELNGRLPQLAREAESQLTVNRLWTAWHQVIPMTATTSDKSNVEILPDGSVRGMGGPRALDYRVAGETTLRNITGVMIESVPDETFTTLAAGLNPDGNFVVTEVTANWSPKSDPTTKNPIAFSDAWADFNQKDFDVKHTIDGVVDRNNKGWALSGTNFQVPHRAALKLKEVMAGDPDGATLSVGVLGRYAARYPIGRFRIWVTDAKDPLAVGLPAKIAAIVSTLPDRRSPQQRSALNAWVAENDAEFQKHRHGLLQARRPIPADKKMEGLQAAVPQAERPITIDSRVIRIRNDGKMSEDQLKHRRLTAAQDLTWALINNPAFLFNH